MMHRRSQGSDALSVLMPCRNGLPFLGEAIDSVLAAPQVLELLVADGGSVDGSLELLRQRAARDPRLRLVSLVDQGVANGLNRALDQARGTVIGWLNADDRYLPGAPERALAALQQHPDWLLVYGEGDHIDAEGAVLEAYPTRPPQVGLEGFRAGCFLCQPTVFWRRSLSVMLGPLETNLQTCFDFEYWLRAFAAFPSRIGHLPERQAQTRLHPRTLSATRLHRAVLEASMLQAHYFAADPPQMLQRYLGQLADGLLPLPPGMSLEQHCRDLLAEASTLPFPPPQLQAISTMLQSWRDAAPAQPEPISAEPTRTASAPDPVSAEEPAADLSRLDAAAIEMPAPLKAQPGPRPHQGRVCVLVLGTHRSGTSALAGCLVRLGCEPPQTPIGACKTNERGFFESWLIHDLNQEILTFLQSHWTDYKPLAWQKLVSEESEAWQQRAVQILQQEFPGTAPIVLKDPRISRLLPFWLRALAATDYAAHAILIHRHPLEVALSLQRRNQLAVPYGQLLWLVSVLEAEQASRSLPRSFLSYGQLLEQAPAIFQRIGQELQLNWPAGQHATARDPQSPLKGFLSADLRHHHASSTPEAKAGSPLPPLLADWIAMTYQSLERFAAGTAEQGDLERLDQTRRPLHTALAALGDWLPPPVVVEG